MSFKSKKHVLVPLAAGFEEIETVVPVDLLRRAGVEVTLAATGGDLLVAGRCGMTLQADALLAGTNPKDFDLLFIPGGPGVALLRKDENVRALVREFSGAGKMIAAICAAPLLLHDAGLLAKRRFTAHFSTAGELPVASGGERVVRDGNFITSRGAGTAQDFGLALVRELCGEAAAGDVARAIMA